MVLKKRCLVCNKVFEKKPNVSKKVFQETTKFCSRRCFHIYHKKIMKGHPNWTTKEGIEKRAKTMRRLYKEGKLIPWNKGKKGLQKWSKEQRKKYMQWLSSHLGEKHPSWKGDKAKHKSTYYQRARKFKKDHCELCKQKLKRLEVHHIDGDITNNDPKNLMTLCNHCHKIIDKRHFKRKRDKKGRFI